MFRDLGAFMKDVIDRQPLSQKEIAAKVGMRAAQLTKIAQGGNAAWEYYDKVAKGCGYRSALEMFLSGGEPRTARLLRAWRALPDDDETRDAAIDDVLAYAEITDRGVIEFQRPATPQANDDRLLKAVKKRLGRQGANAQRERYVAGSGPDAGPGSDRTGKGKRKPGPST